MPLPSSARAFPSRVRKSVFKQPKCLAFPCALPSRSNDRQLHRTPGGRHSAASALSALATTGAATTGAATAATAALPAALAAAAAAAVLARACHCARSCAARSIAACCRPLRFSKL
jgi:hypothetical protein